MRVKVKGLGDVFAGMGQDVADGFGVVAAHFAFDQGDEGLPLAARLAGATRERLTAFRFGAQWVVAAGMDVDAEVAGLFVFAAKHCHRTRLDQRLVGIAAPDAVLAEFVAVDPRRKLRHLFAGLGVVAEARRIDVGIPRRMHIRADQNDGIIETVEIVLSDRPDGVAEVSSDADQADGIAHLESSELLQGVCAFLLWSVLWDHE